MGSHEEFVTKENSSEYILGVNQTELERLEFQHNVWKEITDEFLDQIKIGSGWKCLDAGSGPGFVSADIRQRIGDSGEMTSLEPSGFYLDHFKKICAAKRWTNMKFINASVEDAALEKNYYDLIFMRWVIDFVPSPDEFILKLISSLKPGGVIAIQDYAYEGIALFPKGGKFDGIAEVVRDYWRSGGGDPYYAAKVPSVFRKNEVELLLLKPVSLAGGCDSPVTEWAHRFFTAHLPLMAERNIITNSEAVEYLDDWLKHKKDPDTIFFSPVIVNIIGKKQ